jgi:hypothetical protein
MRIHLSKKLPHKVTTLFCSILALFAFSGLQANDLTTGLLGHYPLDGNASDVSGNGNNGTNHGTTPGTDRFGRPGKASSFDGNNDSISLPIGANLSTDSTDLTFSLWMNTRATDNQDVLEQETDPVKGRSIIVTRKTGIFSTNVSGCGNLATQANYLRNSWYHVVVTNDVTGNSALVSLYLNGIGEGSVTKSNPEPSIENYLLGRSRPANSYLDGLIDDLRIYNRALSASDVQALYNLENTPPNQAPSFSGPATFTTQENNASATFQPTVSDPDGNGLVYNISGGADPTKFDLNASTGSFTFKTTPDIDNQSDANSDKAYRVRVRVSDGTTHANRTFTINVTDLNEAPVFSGPATFTTPENNASATFQPTASDPDGNGLTYQIFGGADHTKFDLNASTGSITFKTTPDFDNPSDANSDNAYRVRVRVSDGTAHANRIFTINVTNLNETPTDLNSTATLSIAENQPVGTFVGQFSATDADANSTLSYRFAGGRGSQHNDRFALDANGTLRTAKVFDYENRQQLKIRVRVADEHNASLRQAFIVSVTDIAESNTTTTDGNSTVEDNATQPPVTERFRPVVETREPNQVSGTSANLRGSLVDNGGSAITERGFLISNKQNPKPGRQNVHRLADVNGSKNFRAVANGLKAGKKYFYRAFATNTQGIALGSVESFTTTAGPPSPSWINAQPRTAANWWTSPWFGNFYLNTNGWIRHEQLGWVFPMESPTAGLWLWKRDFGWLWTDMEIYPFLYQNAQGGWLYFYGQRKGTLLFYDYSAKRWISREDRQ